MRRAGVPAPPGPCQCQPAGISEGLRLDRPAAPCAVEYSRDVRPDGAIRTGGRADARASVPAACRDRYGEGEAPGRVFIDWSQNADSKTTVAVYSLRAKRDEPFVSFPVSWDELERAIATKNAQSLYFDPATALRRLADAGDLYRPVLRLKQYLPGAPRNMSARRRAESTPRM
jgi:hypothetical protein